MNNPPIPCDVECLWEAGAVLGEGLIYDATGRRLWFVDIKRPRLFGYGLDDRKRVTIPLPAQVSAIALPDARWNAPAASGPVFLSTGALGFAWLTIDDATASLSVIAHPEASLPRNRFNDGKLGPDGRFYAGTMDDSETSASGSLYALLPDGRIEQLDAGYRVTNGPAFAPDGRTLYHNDSALQHTYAFDFAADGKLSGKRLFHDHEHAGGYPDGMTTDASGHLFVAMWDGRRIQRVAPDGSPAGYIPLPVQRPTTCVFTDPDSLAFTSASVGVEAPTTGDGGLFHVELRRER